MFVKKLTDLDLIHQPLLEKVPKIAKAKPTGIMFNDSSFQQYEGTQVGQWYVKIGINWQPYGEIFFFKKGFIESCQDLK